MNFFRDVYYVAWGDVRYMRHTIVSILITSLVTPVLYLLAFGYGIDGGAVTIDGNRVPYIDFVIPGIVALTSLSASFSATSARLNVQRLYYHCFDEMMMCPLGNSAIVVGKALIGVIRGLISSGLMFVIGYTLEPSYMHLTPLFIVSLLVSCFTFSFLGVAAALLARSHAAMATFSSLVITPMTFLCGTFFSVASLPAWAQGVLYILPLTESSICIRAATLDIYQFPYWALAVLCAFMTAFFLLDYCLVKYRKVRCPATG